MTDTTVETDLHSDVRLLTEIVNSLDNDVRWYKHDFDENGPEGIGDTLESDLIAFAMIQEARKDLAAVERKLGDILGAAQGTKRKTVMGAGVFERSPRREGSVKCTDEEGLWRLTLDTRIVDPDSGEILPQHEVIRRVYGSESRETGKVRLTGATPTKVEALGIDSDEFFEKPEQVGWTIQLKN